jgi:hypothetical protein
VTVRIVHDDELAYARECVMTWCARRYPEMTLGQVQHLAILVASERQKAMALADPSPRRERRICEPEGLPLPSGGFEDELTEPRRAAP